MLCWEAGAVVKLVQRNRTFLENVGQSKSTVYFKIGLCKFWKKYPMLKNEHYLLITFRRILKLLRTCAKTT